MQQYENRIGGTELYDPAFLIFFREAVAFFFLYVYNNTKQGIFNGP